MSRSFLIKPTVSRKALGGKKLAARLIIGALILSLFALSMGLRVTRAQTSHSLPTQITARDEPADLSISDGPDGVYSFHRTVTCDFDGDGIDDLLITNDTASTNRLHAGEAYVIYGSRSATSPRSINLARAPGHGVDLTIIGPQEGALIGISAAAGDLNNDAIDDIILTGFIMLNGPFSIPIGAVYVILGSANRRVGKIDLAETSPRYYGIRRGTR
jgi:hypothetical protein